MDILSHVKSKMLEYEKCYEQFGEYTKEKKQNTRRWLKALAENKIIFNGGNTQVKYKDFKDIDFTGPEINNQEWRAQLNRFFWLQPIAWEYERTKDKRLAEIARKTIEAWLDFRSFDGTETNQSVWKTTGDNTLSTSIRLGQFNHRGWWGAVPYLKDSGFFDKEFVNRMLESTKDQLNFIKVNNTLLGNWRISQLDTMFFAGYCLPGMEEYLDYAVRNINETFHTQVHSDGSHEEHTPGYHDWMKNVFTRYCYVQKKMPDLGLDIDPVKTGRMWNYSLYLYAPDMKRCGLNDSGRWYENKNPKSVKDAYEKFVEDRNRFNKDFGLDKMDEFKVEDKPSKYFNKAGQFFVKNGWDKSSTMFIFDATNWGGGHCHRSRNSVNMYHNGKMLLIDPGTLNYERSDPFTFYGRSTQAHNTVSVEGMIQTTINPNIEQYYEDDNLCLIHSNYSGGYEGKQKSLSAVHKRTFIWVKDLGSIVYDYLTCNGGEGKFSSSWQTIPGNVIADDSNLKARTDFEDANVLIKAFYSNTDITQNVYTGSWEPPAGWVSKKGASLDGGEPAPMIRYDADKKLSRFEIGQAIIPYNGKKTPDIKVNIKDYPTCKIIKLSIGNKKVIIVSNLLKARQHSLPCQIANAGDIYCDGKTAVLEFDDEKLVYAYGYSCKNLVYKDEAIINEKQWGNHVSK